MDKYSKIVQSVATDSTGTPLYFSTLKDDVALYPFKEYGMDGIIAMIPDFYPSAIAYDKNEVRGTVSGPYSNGTFKGARHGTSGFNCEGDRDLINADERYTGWFITPCDCSEYDMLEHSWTYNDVVICYQYGFVHGIDEKGTSGAHNPITRAEFCQMLYNMGVMGSDRAGWKRILR